MSENAAVRDAGGTGNRGGAYLARAMAFACAKPSQFLVAFLALTFVVWSVLPILLYGNLQLDLVEDLALGKEWQLGYWKHPPLPWWIADLAYRLVRDERVVYLLGPLASVTCIYVAFQLGADIIGPQRALLAALSLQGIDFFNFSAVKFAHDQVQLPFWALTALFFYRAILHSRNIDWMLAGAMLAVAFWSKFAAFALAATLGLILLFDPFARKTWRTRGPYLMAIAFLIVIAPLLVWLVQNEFLPFRYVDDRARQAKSVSQYVLFPIRWTGSQVQHLLPMLGLIGILIFGCRKAAEPATAHMQFGRRYLMAMALGPFLVTTLVAALTGRLAVAMWGYPLWTFLPFAMLAWWEPSDSLRRLQGFAVGVAAVCFAFLIAYVVVEVFEPLVSKRAKASQFPGRELARQVTQAWRDEYGARLAFVGGTEFPTNNIAVYSPDRPSVIVHGNPRLSPWVDVRELEQFGAVFVWSLDDGQNGMPATLADRFPAARYKGSLSLGRQSMFALPQVRIGYAFLPPAAASR